MIMISSPAGQRLARAKVKTDSAWEEAIRLEKESADPDSPVYIHWLLVGRKRIREPAYKSEREFYDAAEALADELIADNHHLGEGD